VVATLRWTGLKIKWVGAATNCCVLSRPVVGQHEEQCRLCNSCVIRPRFLRYVLGELVNQSAHQLTECSEVQTCSRLLDALLHEALEPAKENGLNRALPAFCTAIASGQ